MWGILINSWMINHSPGLSVTAGLFDQQLRGNSRLSCQAENCALPKCNKLNKQICYGMYKISVPFGCYTSYWGPCSILSQCHMVTSAWGVDFAHLCVWVSGEDFIQNHLRTDIQEQTWECTMPESVKNEPGMCDLWLLWWCLCECTQSGSECTKVAWFWGWQCSSVMHWKCPFHLPEPLGIYIPIHIHALNVLVTPVQICSN